jgi:hypothetical protein
MAARLTEKTVILLSPEQKRQIEAIAIEQGHGSTGEVIRQAITLFFAGDVSASKPSTSKQLVRDAA